MSMYPDNTIPTFATPTVFCSYITYLTTLLYDQKVEIKIFFKKNLTFLPSGQKFVWLRGLQRLMISDVNVEQFERSGGLYKFAFVEPIGTRWYIDGTIGNQCFSLILDSFFL